MGKWKYRIPSIPLCRVNNYLYFSMNYRFLKVNELTGQPSLTR